MSRDLVQLWSAPQCESGAVPLGPLTTWTRATVAEALTQAPTLTMSGVLAAELRAAGAREGCALKVLSGTRGVSWWIVTQITDTAEGDVASLRAGPLRTLLAFRGLVRDGDALTVTPVPLRTPSDLLTSLVLSNLTEDQLDWLSLGTVDPTRPVTVGTLTNQTRAQVLTQLEQLTGCTAVLRPLVPDGSTGFALDLLEDPAASATTRLIAPHVMADTITRTRDAQRSPSRVRPVDADGSRLGTTIWEVDAINSLWVTLRDPDASEARWPIRVDGQAVGAKLLQDDGTLHDITDSRASDSAVELDDTTGLSVGDRVRLVADTAGAPLAVVTWPTLTTTRGIGEQLLSVAEAPLEANLASNPFFDTWTSATALSGWTAQGGTYLFAEYPQTQPAALTGVVVDGARSAGSTAIPIRGAPAGTRFYYRDRLVIGGSAYVLNDHLVTATSGGTATLTLASGLGGAGAADGTPITFLRPAVFPDDAPSQTMLRLLRDGTGTTGTGPRLQSPAVKVLYRAASPVLRFAAAFTVYNNAGSGGSLSGPTQLPRIMLRNTATNAVLATATMQSTVDMLATVNETVTGSVTLSADTTVDLAFPPHGNVGMWALVRWVALWLGPSTTPPIVDGSTANATWHAANDALGATANAATVRVTGADLAALLADGDPLTLGQAVRLRVPQFDADATLRVVSLEWSLDRSDRVSMELGAAPTRLSAITVSR